MINRVYCLLLFLIICLSCSNKEEVLNQRIDKINENIKNGNLRDALYMINESIKRYPDEVRFISLRGDVYYRMKNYTDSKSDYRMSMNINPNNVSIVFFVGLDNFFLEQYDSAVYYFNKAIALKGSDTAYIDYNPNSSINGYINDVSMVVIRYYRGISYFFNDDYKNSINDLNFSLSNNFNKGKCYFYFGLIESGLSNKDQACKYFNLALSNGISQAEKYITDSCR